jgi:hypothetical protein
MPNISRLSISLLEHDILLAAERAERLGVLDVLSLLRLAHMALGKVGGKKMSEL